MYQDGSATALTAHPPTQSVETMLRDGTRVLIRPVVPEDKALLKEGLNRLSELSRYRRFMAPVKELTDEQLRYFTEIDYRNHMAWGAVELAHPTRGLGVARYIRFTEQPTVAEVAITVVDAHQGLGLGTLLLYLLTQSAVENGIKTFIAHVLAENAPMITLFRDLGATVRYEEPNLVRVEVPVPESPADLPNTPAGRAFRAIARRMAAR